MRRLGKLFHALMALLHILPFIFTMKQKTKVVNIFLFCNKQRKSEECDDEAAKKAKQEEKGAGDAKPNGHAWF